VRVAVPPDPPLIASDLPAAFQELIRQTYPNFAQQPSFIANTNIGIPNVALPIGPSGPSGPSGVAAGVTIGPTIGWGQRYTFWTEDATRTVTLTPESVSIAERNYVQWDDLRAEVEAIRGHLEAVYAPAFDHGHVRVQQGLIQAQPDGRVVYAITP